MFTILLTFGGIGLFYKSYITQDFNIKIFDRSIDLILSVLFTHWKSDFKLTINVCYLPPENSRWGRDVPVFLIIIY